MASLTSLHSRPSTIQKTEETKENPS